MVPKLELSGMTSASRACRHDNHCLKVHTANMLQYKLHVAMHLLPGFWISYVCVCAMQQGTVQLVCSAYMIAHHQRATWTLGWFAGWPEPAQP